MSAALEALARASLWLAVVLPAAVALGALLFRRRPAARFRLVMAALLLSAPAPLYLALAGAAGASTWLEQPGTAVRELRELVAPVMPSPPPAAPASRPSPPAPAAPIPAAEVVGLLWLAGVAFGLVRIGHGLRRTRRLRNGARACAAVAEPSYPVLVSPAVSAAAVTGLWRPVILVAPSLLAGPPAALQQVLLHEAAHARRRDPLWGLLERLVQALYWFHPAVLLCRRSLCRAREEACDDRVLARFGAAEYARTLLALATAPGDRVPAGAAGAATAVSRRIRRLLHPQAAPTSSGTASAALAAAGLIALAAATGLVLAPASAAGPRRDPPIWVAAPAPDASAPEFAAAGSDVRGAFVLADGDAVIAVVNQPLASQALTPASTFKVLIALAGLDSGVIPDAHTRLALGDRPQPMSAWNRDHDLASAMRTSATWYFQDVLDRLDRADLARLLERLDYGNRRLDGDRLGFWMDGALRISALQQARAQVRLAEGRTGSPARSLALLAQVTELRRHGDHVMYGKTGTATEDGQVVAWLVGHVHDGRADRRFGYAMLMRAPEAESRRLQQTRHAITRALLVRHGVWPAGDREAP